MAAADEEVLAGHQTKTTQRLCFLFVALQGQQPLLPGAPLRQGRVEEAAWHVQMVKPGVWIANGLHHEALMWFSRLESHIFLWAWLSAWSHFSPFPIGSLGIETPAPLEATSQHSRCPFVFRVRSIPRRLYSDRLRLLRAYPWVVQG